MPHRVLITGARGQLGRALVKTFSTRLEVLPTAHVPAGDGVPACDVTDWQQVQATVSDFSPDVIINLAALTDVDRNEREPELAKRVNTTGVEYLLSACELSGARLVQLSSDYVFNGQAGPYLEDDAPAPLNVYGRSKLEAETLVMAGNGHLVIRANVLFGPDLDSDASFVGWVAGSLRKGNRIRVVDDQIGNPTLTTHLAEAIVAAVEQDAVGLYHYGGLEFASRFAFAREIARHAKLPMKLIAPVATAELNQLAPRPLKSGLVCSRMKMELKVQNATLDQALAEAFSVN